MQRADVAGRNAEAVDAVLDQLVCGADGVGRDEGRPAAAPRSAASPTARTATGARARPRPRTTPGARRGRRGRGTVCAAARARAGALVRRRSRRGRASPSTSAHRAQEHVDALLGREPSDVENATRALARASAHPTRTAPLSTAFGATAMRACGASAATYSSRRCARDDEAGVRDARASASRAVGADRAVVQRALDPADRRRRRRARPRERDPERRLVPAAEHDRIGATQPPQTPRLSRSQRPPTRDVACRQHVPAKRSSSSCSSYGRSGFRRARNTTRRSTRSASALKSGIRYGAGISVSRATRLTRGASPWRQEPPQAAHDGLPQRRRNEPLDGIAAAPTAAGPPRRADPSPASRRPRTRARAARAARPACSGARSRRPNSGSRPPPGSRAAGAAEDAADQLVLDPVRDRAAVVDHERERPARPQDARDLAR